VDALADFTLLFYHGRSATSGDATKPRALW
jgi:hypothetical protein